MNNREMVRRSLAAVWHPCTQMKAHESAPMLAIAGAKGPWLYDFEGNRYLDGVSSWWVNLFGHGHPEINAALREQIDSLSHVMLAGATHAPAVDLAERLAKVAPGNLGHVFFASDGASATEIALKMAFHYWTNHGRPDKRRFVHLEGGYHGETVGALAVTDVPLFRDAYAPLLREGLAAPFPSRTHDDHQYRGARGAQQAADALATLFEARHAEIAALILEPLVQGASGMRMYHPDYLKRARELCDKHEVLLIADEIMTGFGRTGTMFACEQAHIAPDLLCLSKGITGGYLPLSCVLATDAIYQAFYGDSMRHAFLHSHSYTGNALACRAACAVLDIFEREDVIVENEKSAARFSAAAAPLAHHAGIRDFRHLGMIWAFEVVTSATDFSLKAAQLALERGVVLRPIGNTVYFMPPYVAGDAEFALLVDAGLAIVERFAEAA
jgi:adenosylmethionine---8-amino-7-oxononanoate aminotransferase